MDKQEKLARHWAEKHLKFREKEGSEETSAAKFILGHTLQKLFTTRLSRAGGSAPKLKPKTSLRAALLGQPPLVLSAASCPTRR